jgi:hypothetical protein
MATIFSDDFNRADAGDLGSNYDEDANGLDIVSNQAKSTTSNARVRVKAASFPSANADYEVQADGVHNTPSVGDVYLYGRAVDGDNLYRLRISTFDQAVKIQKVVSASATDLGSYTGGYVSGTTYTVKLSMSGTTLKAYVNGTERVSVTDSTYTATGVPGMRTGMGGGNVIIDNFLVTGTLSGATAAQNLLTLLDVGI